MLMLKIMKNMQKSEYDLRLRISNPYMKIMYAASAMHDYMCRLA